MCAGSRSEPFAFCFGAFGFELHTIVCFFFCLDCGLAGDWLAGTVGDVCMYVCMFVC
jgi:hypothetical protein